MADGGGNAQGFTSRIPRPSSFGVRIDNTVAAVVDGAPSPKALASPKAAASPRVNDVPKVVGSNTASAATATGGTRTRTARKAAQVKDNDQSTTAADNKGTSGVANKRKQAAVNTTKPGAVKRSNTTEVERETWNQICEREGLNVDSLLAIRISGKNKFDFKGRCEQQMTYIKQMRACIRHLRDSEAAAGEAMKDLEKNLEQRSEADNNKKAHMEKREAELMNEIEVLNAASEELEKRIVEVQERSEKTLQDQIDATRVVEQELKEIKDVLKDKESELKQLHLERERMIADAEAQAAQLATLQDMHAKANEYATSLQEYNAKLQSEAAAATEAMGKTAADRVELQTDLANLRGAHEALQEKLTAALASNKELDEKYRQTEEEREKLRASHEELTKDRNALREGLEAEKTALNGELVSLRGAHENTSEQLRMAKSSADELEKARQQLTDDLSRVRSEVEASQKEKGEMKLKLEGDKAEMQTEIAALKGAQEALQGQLKASSDSLEEAEATRQKLTEDLSKSREEFETLQGEKGEMKLKLEGEKAELQTEIAALKGAQEALQSQVKSAATNLDHAQQARQMTLEDLARLRGEMDTIRRECENLKSDLAVAHEEINEHKEIKEKSFAELDSAKNTTESLESRCHSQEQTIADLKRDVDTVTRRLKIAEDCSGQRLHEYDELNAMFNSCKEELAECKKKVFEGEMVRRKLHNTIQELKGNIRVFCRVRPLMGEELTSGADTDYRIKYPEAPELVGRAIELQHGEKGPQYNFSFDKVFQPVEEQPKVFEEISMLVQSALDGYKVCIFAYGQTGSGKTHTMLGTDEAPGMIPLSLAQIFESSAAMAEDGWEFRMQASMLEIHNEEIRDLLSKAKTDPKTHSIKHDATGTTVNALKVVEVKDAAQVSSLLQRAAKARSVGKTQMNEQSSRSHMVFTLRLDGTNSKTGQSVGGVLNLIDLAGSERLSRSGATGDRLKETQSINKSLSALGDVILSLHNRDSHVPYRNSKLTYLLQPCLGGESKTLMFVNVAPSVDSANETLCSLRFAAKVNACEVGTARKQTRKGSA